MGLKGLFAEPGFSEHPTHLLGCPKVDNELIPEKRPLVFGDRGVAMCQHQKPKPEHRLPLVPVIGYVPQARPNTARRMLVQED